VQDQEVLVLKMDVNGKSGGRLRRTASAFACIPRGFTSRGSHVFAEGVIAEKVSCDHRRNCGCS